MTKDELISYWLECSDRDFVTMENLFASKDYHWALFVGHLVVEKLLKAYYVKTVDNHPPLIHALLRLAEKSGLTLTEEQKDVLVTATTFNLRARYDDYKYAFYKSSTKEYAEKWISKITEFRKWIKELLLK